MSEQESLSDQVRRKHNLSFNIASEAIDFMMDDFDRKLLIKSVAAKIKPYVIMCSRDIFDLIIQMGNVQVDRRAEDIFIDDTSEPIPSKMDTCNPMSM